MVVKLILVYNDDMDSRGTLMLVMSTNGRMLILMGPSTWRLILTVSANRWTLM